MPTNRSSFCRLLSPLTFKPATAALALTLGLALSQAQPQVATNGQVTFRLRAPNAQTVKLRCEGIGEATLQKDDKGLWTFTSRPLEPDIYTYSFDVDGLRTIDLSNPFQKYNLLNCDSQVHVPGPASLPWELNDVPHGQVHRHFYHSKAADDDRDFYVYTPPGYNPRAWKHYPALYLLHGYSDDASAWVAAGRANVILDNLIAQGKAKPMIVVMPLGYGTMEILRAGWTRVRNQDLWQRNQDNFQEALLTEVIPQVEKAYRVQSKPASRAIAGLSMGGAESLYAGLNNPDKFAWVGAFSSAVWGTNSAKAFTGLNAGANQQFRLIWIGCGEQDGLLKGNQEFCGWLKSIGVNHTWVQTPGEHSFRVWRRYLAEFAPLLFQK
jgi:enterochelin esterase family protein